MKKSVVSLVLTAVSLPAVPAEPQLDRLVGCTDIKESRDRLACFDREVAPLASARARPGSAAPAPVARAESPAPAAPTAPTRPAAPPSAISTFGQDQLAREQRPDPKAEELTLHARLTSQKPAGGGFVNLYLDNGQVWRHQDQVLGAYLRDGDAVTIEKGALGSYKLSRDAGKSRNWIRVTRLR